MLAQPLQTTGGNRLGGGGGRNCTVNTAVILRRNGRGALEKNVSIDHTDLEHSLKGPQL